MAKKETTKPALPVKAVEKRKATVEDLPELLQNKMKELIAEERIIGYFMYRGANFRLFTIEPEARLGDIESDKATIKQWIDFAQVATKEKLKEDFAKNDASGWHWWTDRPEILVLDVPAAELDKFMIRIKNLYNFPMHEGEANPEGVERTNDLKVVAKDELDRLKDLIEYSHLYPVLAQWINYLSKAAGDIEEETDSTVTLDDSDASKFVLAKYSRKFLLFYELGIIDLLADKKKHDIFSLTKSNKINIMRLLLQDNTTSDDQIYNSLMSIKYTNRSEVRKPLLIEKVQNLLRGYGLSDFKSEDIGK